MARPRALAASASRTLAYGGAGAAAVCLIVAGFLPDGGSLFVLVLVLLLLLFTGAAMGMVHITTIHMVYRLGSSATAAARQGFLEAAATGILPLSYLLYGFIFEQLPLGTPWIIRSTGAGIMILSVLLYQRSKAAGVQ